MLKDFWVVETRTGQYIVTHPTAVRISSSLDEINDYRLDFKDIFGADISIRISFIESVSNSTEQIRAVRRRWMKDIESESNDFD